ncbi:hypothetical protein DFH94DRAFT_149353 [Russula ochroleuca]|uniref:Uncharacterized protein n=1 Tax=Russula ochroleuca TaxID=152965 RepID=A0A9P5K138_9AGAM|nr:hypothetical protein DFH94DRAFT_149353 [Russula ochroleuca]
MRVAGKSDLYSKYSSPYTHPITFKLPSASGMDNFHDSAIMASAQTQLPSVKFWHAIGGLYFWEFFTTLDYEWRVIRGDLPYRWSIWIYSLTRVATLVGVIVCLATMDVTTPINCQPLVLFSIILFYLSASTASLLIVLRIIAIWKRNKVVVTLAITVWGISIAFHFQNVSQLRFAWDPTQQFCEPVRFESGLLNFIPTILSHTVLLLIMLVGLLKLRRRDGGTFGLVRLLWKQGVIWLALATAAEIPPVVLIILDVNNQLNNIFETPTLITLTIAATRMHRSLVDFVSRCPEVAHKGPQVSSIVFSKTKQKDSIPTALDRIEIAVHTSFEQHPTSPVNNDDSSTVSISEQVPQIVGGSSKLNLTRASTCPLPTISPSPIPRVQGV